MKANIRRGVTCSGGVGDLLQQSRSGGEGRSEGRSLLDLLPSLLNEGSTIGGKSRGVGGSTKLTQQLREAKQQAAANRLENETLKVYIMMEALWKSATAGIYMSYDMLCPLLMPRGQAQLRQSQQAYEGAMRQISSLQSQVQQATQVCQSVGDGRHSNNNNSRRSGSGQGGGGCLGCFMGSGVGGDQNGSP